VSTEYIWCFRVLYFCNHDMYLMEMSKLAEVVMLLNCIQKVSCLNLSQHTTYCAGSRYSSVPPGMCWDTPQKIGYSCFMLILSISLFPDNPTILCYTALCKVAYIGMAFFLSWPKQLTYFGATLMGDH